MEEDERRKSREELTAKIIDGHLNAARHLSRQSESTHYISNGEKVVLTINEAEGNIDLMGRPYDSLPSHEKMLVLHLGRELGYEVY